MVYDKHNRDSEYFDSVDIFPALTIISIICIFGFGIYFIVQDIQIARENSERIVIEESINEEITEGVIIDEKLYNLVDAENKELTEKDINALIQTIIESENIQQAQIE